MLNWSTLLVVLLSGLVAFVDCQKLLVIVADGFAGSFYYKYSRLTAFRQFEQRGVWSDWLYSEFPTLSLPNRQTLVTGLYPRHHNFVGDYLLNSTSGDVFNNFESSTDFDKKWWRFEPIYVTAARAGAKVALFFWPECAVAWPHMPTVCIPPSQRATLNPSNVPTIVQATRTHDLVMVYHEELKQEATRLGPVGMTAERNGSVNRFERTLRQLNREVESRIDLNLMVVSTHGMVEVSSARRRQLDEYLDMNLVQMTVGSGAVMQIVSYPGKTHQIFDQLRNREPIPNVKIYYTTPRMGDLPNWYGYRRSELIPELVLIAQPGFSIETVDEKKRIPKRSEMAVRGLSGYNNEFPDMLGVFLARGPMFKKGLHKGPCRLVDVYPLMCHILSLKCPQTDANMSNIEDVLKFPPMFDGVRQTDTISFILFLFVLLIVC